MKKGNFIVVFLEDGRAIKTDRICNELLDKVVLGDACVVDISRGEPLEYRNGSWQAVAS